MLACVGTETRSDDIAIMLRGYITEIGWEFGRTDRERLLFAGKMDAPDNLDDVDNVCTHNFNRDTSTVIPSTVSSGVHCDLPLLCRS